MNNWLAINIVFWMCGSMVSIYNENSDGVFFALAASVFLGIFYIILHM
jgi:hypothetical protein